MKTIHFPFRVLWIGIVLICFSTVPIVEATPLQSYPGFLKIGVWFLETPNWYSTGLTSNALLSQGDVWQELPWHYQGELYGALTDIDRNADGGDDYFSLRIDARSGRYLLDSVALIYNDGAGVKYEYPIAVKVYPGTFFGSGFDASDLQAAMGPMDGSYIEIISGYLTFTFPFSVPPPEPPSTPVPEPSTMILLCSGLIGAIGLLKKLR
jgi:hypothetical protein